MISSLKVNVSAFVALIGLIALLAPINTEARYLQAATNGQNLPYTPPLMPATPTSMTASGNDAADLDSDDDDEDGDMKNLLNGGPRNNQAVLADNARLSSHLQPQPAASVDLKTSASHHHHGHHAKGWLDMGAWTGKKGAFGWYDKHPVGKGK